jgi:hypothetical protein
MKDIGLRLRAQPIHARVRQPLWALGDNYLKPIPSPCPKPVALPTILLVLTLGRVEGLPPDGYDGYDGYN